MKKNILSSVIITLVIIGVTGCGSNINSDTKQTTIQNTPVKPTITKQPVIKNTHEDAYDFCEAQGNELIIRFDQETESSKAYCRFSDTTECDAQAVFYATCAPGNGSSKYEFEQVENKIIFCAEDYTPVCGENGVTYSNECIASTNNIKVDYEGVCLKIQTENATDETNQINNTIVKPETTPNWIDVIIEMIKIEPKKTPPAYINQCVYKNNIVYYQSDGCKDCYDILYNNVGQVMCYPSHDLTNQCKDYLKSNTGCKRIWTDTR